MKEKEKITISKYLVLLILAICIAPVCSPLLLARNNEAKKVLVLHSYHHGLSWDDGIDRGIESVFEKSDLDIEIQFEYMDTKRIYDQEYLDKLYKIYKYKFRNRKVNLIISTDNNAFNFLLEHGNELFPQTPVVFCGVNDFKDGMLEDRSLYTGTVEAIDIRETLDVALKLHPKTEHFIVYGDNSPTYLANKAILERIIPDYERSIDFIFKDNFNIREIREHILKLPSNSLILLISTIRDEQGQLISFQRSAEMMAAVSSVPLYGCWDFFLGHGIVGGKLISGFSQGETAAHIALTILNGEKVENIPVLKESPNRYMFDYKQMQRFGIDLSDIPEDSIVINKPRTFYSEHKGLIWSAIVGIGGLVLIIFILASNIIIRRRAEESLLESKEHYRTLFEGSRDAIFLHNLEGKFIDANQAMLDLFGYTREEMIGMNSIDIHAHPEDRSKFLNELVQKGFHRDYEIKLKKKDGTEIDCLLTASIRRADDGTIIGYQGIIRDISDKKLLESQLLQAQKMEAVGRLAGGIAHDFNNLLTTIIGNTELSLLRTGKDNPLCENIAEIKKAANRAASLTRQLLAFSRKQVLQPVVLNLNTVICSLEKMIGRLIGEDVELETLLSPDLGEVRADAGQMEQVIMNLVINARDAMPRGGKLIIETANVDLDENYASEHGVKLNPGPYVMLAVSDTGKGIDKETQSRIFEPFFTTKEKGKGTGLGLSTVYGIVKQSGGLIWVYSELGEGTTFKIYLPRIRCGSEPLRKEQAPLEAPKGVETVLIVEDDDAVRSLACKILELQGYKILEAKDGEEAMKVSKEYKGPIHLMITDVVMPGISGRELQEQLHPLRPAMKVLYMSGYTDNATAYHKVLDSGVAFLQKPFTPETLARKVREVLED